MSLQSDRRNAHVSPGVGRQALVQVYQPRAGDPIRRPLRVFTMDATTARIQGSVASIDVPWEPLRPGPEGAFLQVEGGEDGGLVDLDSSRILINGGLDPSVSNLAFHQQMIYAVCAKVYAQFRHALGRVIAWGFDQSKLRLVPHAEGLDNAQYEPDQCQIRFGSFAAERGGSRIRQSGKVYTCLSHDIIAHEFTHALVDGLRSHFTIPTSKDVLAFHEGFADLVALLQHFTYPEVVETAIRRSQADLSKAPSLTSIAQEFGEVTGGGPLRTAVTDKIVPYDPDMEPHDMGGVLLSAVFAAFTQVYARKVEPFVAMAYRPPSGYMTAELVKYLAEKASQLAAQFLHMSIRALDYCPPVDLQLGEYLRAMITADRELMPEDPWGYRDALITAFAARGLFPPGVDQLSEDALVWRAPSRPLGPVNALHFANLRFAGDPSLPASREELVRQALALWDFVTREHVMQEFGLAPESAEIGPACVESIRTSRRAGENGEVLFDLVAEIIQRRTVVDPETGFGAPFYGGSTVIIGPMGEIRYVISKNVGSEARLAAQRQFQRESDYWQSDPETGQLKMRGYAHQLAHRKA